MALSSDGGQPAISVDSLKFIIHSVFLPPKLPQQDDSEPGRDQALVTVLLHSLNKFAATGGHAKARESAVPLLKMLDNIIRSRAPNGGLIQKEVENQLSSMKDLDILVFHIKAQNAALFIRRQGDEYVFETFEVSCPNAVVMSTAGRVQRDLPSEAIAISAAQMDDPTFRTPFVEMLVKLDVFTPGDAYRKAQKAGEEQIEVRNAIDPRYFTEMVFGILRGMGEARDIHRVHKHVRDDVIWSEALAPWRRSPLWLVLRVAMQTVFENYYSTSTTNKTGRCAYKAFMVYFMTCALEIAATTATSHELLRCMQLKIIRRLQKMSSLDQGSVVTGKLILQPTVPHSLFTAILTKTADLPWVKFIQRISMKTTNVIDGNWNALQDEVDPYQTQIAWAPSTLSFKDDTVLQITSLKKYFDGVMNREIAETSLGTANISYATRIPYKSLQIPLSNMLTGKMGASRRLVLADVETWVADSLAAWENGNIHRADACSEVANLVIGYVDAASAAYTRDPVSLSTMYLTALDLWVCLDKISTKHESILLDYEPGFPATLFEPLLLPKKCQMERLLAVEQHIATRKLRSRPLFSTVFSSFSSKSSLAVRYFEQSEIHQNLLADIERKAHKIREKKRKELIQKEQQKKELEAMAKAAKHEMVTNYSVNKRTRKSEPYERHLGSCSKCRWETQAEKMSIDVHEWPLPSESRQAKAVVFELQCPATISIWRETTYYMLSDVFTPASAKQNAGHHGQRGKYRLRAYDGLSSYHNLTPKRLEVASGAKPFATSHYRSKPVSIATEDNICVKHALRYEMYDSSCDTMATHFLGQCSIRENCTQQVPNGPYQSLQRFASNTLHTPNQVIAEQSLCPPEVTIHEFLTFGHLRSGHRLQWENIALALADGTLKFNEEAVHILITQASHEIGPSSFNNSDVLRDTHVLLDDVSFAKDVVESLLSAVTATEENWQGATSMKTFIKLALRVLSISSQADVRRRCFDVLTVAREATLSWLQVLAAKVRACGDSEEQKTWTNSALEVALSCSSTFDVDVTDMRDMFSTENNLAAFIECAVTIHDICPMLTTGLPQSIQHSLFHFHKMAQITEPIVYDLVTNDPTGIDHGVGQLWTSYRPGTSWRAAKVGTKEWITTETLGDQTTRSLVIHLNLLTGSLLVDGSPLGRLPSTYETHASYQRLFGAKVLGVMPSAMAGMCYGSREAVFGYQLDFALRDGILIIRATKNEKKFEILPPDSLQGDFPPAFVNKYSHWLDLASNTVEFRPLADPWQAQNHNWIVSSLTSQQCRMMKDAACHVDMHSPTFRAIAQVLSPIEKPEHIHASLTDTPENLEVALPRLKLDFFVNVQQDLECKQRRGMVVDLRQSCDVFTGLRNKLILRSPADASRSIVVPHGLICSKITKNHVEVYINSGVSADVPYHYYELDVLLQRLTDNGQLSSVLFRALLHAMTSHCLPDKFTGRTGTEQATHCLQEASTRSFRILGRGEIELLKTIASLTPRRVYYPTHLQEMQTVAWDSGLPPLSQHENFSTLVSDIFEIASEHQIFYDSGRLPGRFQFGTSSLLTRAITRHKVFRAPGFGAESSIAALDVVYSAMARPREQAVCQLSNSVNRWTSKLTVSTTLLHDIEGWSQSMKGITNINVNALGFDKSWLGATEDMPTYWCSLVALFTRSDETVHKYRIMFFLSTLLYSNPESNRLIQTLLSFATVPQLRALSLPDQASYTLSDGYAPNKSEIVALVTDNAKGFYQSPESKLPKLVSELSEAQADARRHFLHEEKGQDYAIELSEKFMSQWPSATVHLPTDAKFATYFDVRPIPKAIGMKFASWFRNKAFEEFIKQVQSILNTLKPSQIVTGTPIVPTTTLIPSSVPSPCLNWSRLFRSTAPLINPVDNLSFDNFLQNSLVCKNYHRTQNLIDQMLALASDQYEKRYCLDMVQSLESLQESSQDMQFVPEDDDASSLHSMLQDALARYQAHKDSSLASIKAAFLAKATLADKLAHDVSMWPRMSPTGLLQHLFGSRAISSEWTRALIQYGIAIAKMQHCRRALSLIKNPTELLRELLNRGHVGWDAEEYPEWLLFEVENNLFIRPTQAQIAKEMLSPSSGGNCCYQMNMGEGKTSVIIPIIAATLAKGILLPRVLVLPALSAQMFHILRQKLGGLLNCRVVSLPFSRSVQLSTSQAMAVHKIYEKCLAEKCVVLCQPEHILSFDLMGIEKSLAGADHALGSQLVKTQQWIDRNTRDLLDESDEILNVKFELVYTIGLQNAVDFSPHRWTIVSRVLGILQECLMTRLEELREKFPDGFQVYQTGPGEIPRLQILQSQAGEMLLSMVIHQILDRGLPGFPVWTFGPEEKIELLAYISEVDRVPPCSSPKLAALFDMEHSRKMLLLLKGLFAHGVMLFVFQHKRWRVTYGHDFSRSLLAVPYRAKDLPSLRSEFSHPDVTVILTCLSYYHEGLSDDQMFACFETLLESDDPEGEYDSWVSQQIECPVAFRHLSGINLRDRPQCLHIVFPVFHRSKVVIDFYMARLAFPKEMKEFPEKLSSSGWDIARSTNHPITGFSGTNDSRYLLPLSVTQADIPEMVHTNATVLDCLLQPHNTYSIIPDAGDTNALLELVVTAEPQIRVILDVGALVLDLRNDEMARAWLKRVPSLDVEAVVYFDDADELVVLTRDGRVQSLQESPMLKQMDKCLVYLDEAHTRGTDLKLPSYYRAAATLGVNLTKDRFVQGRHPFFTTYSVMLCAPHEIQRKIMERSGRQNTTSINVEDVLIWTMSNTHEYTRKCVPLWAIQGARHLKREIVWHGAAQPDAVLEPEAKSLSEWYGIHEGQGSVEWLNSFGNDVLKERPDEVKAIHAKMVEFGTVSIDGAALEEQQERELSPESEQERQLERPLQMKPLQHVLHAELLQMVKQGWLESASQAFVPAFRALSKTSANAHFNLKDWPKGLLATKDFSQTVEAPQNAQQDDFIRPVQWILSCPKSQLLVVISPFEANELHPHIRSQGKTALHLYSPRIKDSMKPLDNLRYCAVPSRIASDPLPELYTRIQLNLFAGQLYFKDREDYNSACRFLGLAFCAPEKGVKVSTDGFVAVEDRERYDAEMKRVCTMAKSPVDLLRALTEMRRKGQGYGKTHMGLLLGGELLKDRAFSA
ncbi:p-loop containing nucleoside triphosphate hydrolase protein [Venturia nashicola]|nr:p-loop containing nucleoside triphosphate hydrolase protein [Venturia nashicola]